jgi:signal transduction histidine kinase
VSSSSASSAASLGDAGQTSDARRELRVAVDPARAPIAFDVLGGEPRRRPQLKLGNISRSGMFLEGDEGAKGPEKVAVIAYGLEPGQSLHFAVKLGPNGEEVTGVARVRWVRKKDAGPYMPKGIGVQVLEFHENAEKRYLEYLESCLLSLKITDLMDPSVAGVPAELMLGDAFAELGRAKTGCLAVVDKVGVPTGIFTKTDALRLTLQGARLTDSLGQHMTPSPLTATSEHGLETAYDLMRARKINHLPVVDDGILVGVLTTAELLPYWAEFMDLQTKRLARNYDNAMSIIAHDLRTPIAVIQTTNALLTSGELEPKDYADSGFPDVLEGTCATMMRLIDDLLDLNKIKVGAIRLERKSVDLEELIERVTRSFTAVAAAKKIKIEIDAPVAVPKIKADALRLEQVLNNLIGNALKFSPEGRTVVVGLKPHHSKVALWVADCGPGIPAGEIDQLFNEFNTLSVKATGGEKSTGLGLAIAKRLVEAHGGSIRVDSEPMRGTTFTVFLPIGEIQ